VVTRTQVLTAITRRDAIRLVGAVSAGTLWAAAQSSRFFPVSHEVEVPRTDLAPPLAPGLPTSPERMALIDAFKQKSEGVEKNFEARSYKGDWVMPYRLFRPTATGKLPLILYLHGSGGLGDDNQKQMGLGNIFGTRVWALPDNQKDFPCYVVAPQTDRGWARYDLSQQNDGPAKVLPGLGDGSRLALEIVDALRREFAIDDRRIYVTGQSMGGAGVWNVIMHRPNFFAAAVICCGSRSTEDGTGSIKTALWAFQGDADQTVPVTLSRERIAARRKAGGHPLYTEYAGVDHNVWEWAYTEPELPKWVFAQRRG
jgi:predicted peptidase